MTFISTQVFSVLPFSPSASGMNRQFKGLSRRSRIDLQCKRRVTASTSLQLHLGSGGFAAARPRSRPKGPQPCA